MDFDVLEDGDMQLIDNSKLAKAKKTVRKYKNDYYIKAARDGSEWKFINYAYIPEGFQCEWCGNTNGPPKHAYFIEHTETGERKIIGSVCIDKVTKLGKAYREIPEFKKKIEKLQKLKNWDRNEFVERVMEVSGEKEKIMIELQDIEEQIQKKIQEDKEERKREREKARKEEEKKLNEQDKWLDDNDLKRIKPSSSFTRSVIEQHEDHKILSSKQRNALKKAKKKIEDIYGSVDYWEEKYQEEDNIMTAVDSFRYSGRSIWNKHREFLDSIISQYQQAKYYPTLSDKQIEAVKNILDHYSVDY